MANLNVKEVLGAAATVINNPTKNIRDILGIDDLDEIDILRTVGQVAVPD